MQDNIYLHFQTLSLTNQLGNKRSTVLAFSMVCNDPLYGLKLQICTAH